jgi:hypothetical protein
MYRPLSLPLTCILLLQAAAFEWPVCNAVSPRRWFFSPLTFYPYLQATTMPSPTCETASDLARQSEESSFPPARYLEGAARLSSILVTTSAQKDVHARVGVIVGACLGVAGGVLLIGLGLFWILLRHRQHTATTQTQDVVPRSWVPSDFLRGHGVAVVANHPSLSLDLAGADANNMSVVPASEETAETKRWNGSTDVLDISVENAPQSPLPPPRPQPIEPYVPTTQASDHTPTLCIHTDVRAESSSSPQGSQEGWTSPGSSRSPLVIRPLQTPPTAMQHQMRRPRSAKIMEVQRESRRSRLSRSAVSADDLRAYVHGGDRRSTAHSISSMTCEAADACEIVQHHDGGVNARIDLPPPYYECICVQATPPSSQLEVWP